MSSETQLTKNDISVIIQSIFQDENHFHIELFDHSVKELIYGTQQEMQMRVDAQAINTNDQQKCCLMMQEAFRYKIKNTHFILDLKFRTMAWHLNSR